jgi:hypothetical protein
MERCVVVRAKPQATQRVPRDPRQCDNRLRFSFATPHPATPPGHFIGKPSYPRLPGGAKNFILDGYKKMAKTPWNWRPAVVGFMALAGYRFVMIDSPLAFVGITRIVKLGDLATSLTEGTIGIR